MRFFQPPDSPLCVTEVKILPQAKILKELMENRQIKQNVSTHMKH